MFALRFSGKYLNRALLSRNYYSTLTTRRNLKRICLGIGAGSAALFVGYGVYGHIPKSFDVKNLVPTIWAAKIFDPGNSSNIDNTNNDSKRLSQRFNFIADVVEKISPGVVFIEIKERHPFTGQYVTVASGSGIIIEANGLIVTNAHVIDRGPRTTNITVKLNNGRVFKGMPQVIDNVADLALLKIDCNNLPTLKLGSSATLRPGEWVVAMGSPLTLSNTITAGVISSVQRKGVELGLHHKHMEYIQTDAAINVGNSGGPLANLDGEVIGINTLKVTAGISFAIPSDKVKEFLQESERVIEEHKHKSGWFHFSHHDSPQPSIKRFIGVTMITLTPQIAQELEQRRHMNFPPNVTHGVLIWKVILEAPAHKNGIRAGDVIIEVNGKPATCTADIYNSLKSEKLDLVILRGQEKLMISVVPYEIP